MFLLCTVNEYLLWLYLSSITYSNLLSCYSLLFTFTYIFMLKLGRRQGLVGSRFEFHFTFLSQWNSTIDKSMDICLHKVRRHTHHRSASIGHITSLPSVSVSGSLSLLIVMGSFYLKHIPHVSWDTKKLELPMRCIQLPPPDPTSAFVYIFHSCLRHICSDRLRSQHFTFLKYVSAAFSSL